MKDENDSRDEQRSHSRQHTIEQILLPGTRFAPLKWQDMFNRTHNRETFPLRHKHAARERMANRDLATALARNRSFPLKKSIGQKRSTNGLGYRQNALDMLKENALIELVTLLWQSYLRIEDVPVPTPRWRRPLEPPGEGCDRRWAPGGVRGAR